MMPYTVRPLEPWLGPATPFDARRPSPFTAKWSDTLKLLDRELRHLGVIRPWVLQIDVAQRSINRDGTLSARAIPTSPAIRVCFDARPSLGSMMYPADRYQTWQANVRAVALTLEALRAVDRWGATSRGEQYRGWTAIAARPADMSREQAAEFIAHWSGLVVTQQAILRDEQTRSAAYRAAAKRAHPDVTGDDGDTMARLNTARDLLLAGTRG